MNQQQALRSASRRLRHRSRSVAVSVTLAAGILVAAWAGTEAVLAALGLPPLLIAPADLLRLAAGDGWVTVVAGALLALIGVALVIVALAPARLRRRELADDRMVWIIDDDVIAGGLSRVAARAAGVPSSQVRTAVGRRNAVTRVRPTTGFTPDLAATTRAAQEVVASIAPVPAPRARVLVEKQGVLS